MVDQAEVAACAQSSFGFLKSCWSYRDVTLDGFKDECVNLRQMIRGAINKPFFLVGSGEAAARG
jgi:hypothetical protein